MAFGMGMIGAVQGTWWAILAGVVIFGYGLDSYISLKLKRLKDN